MQILAVNVGQPRTVEHNGKQVTTGIFKSATSGRVAVHQRNLAGDGQADLYAHGGTYKAIYAYPHEHYSHWAQAIDRTDFVYGQFGENLTIIGLLETEVYVGNIYRVGTALMQVTQPRVPCYKLGIRMGDTGFVKRFMHAQRTGFYLRVLEEGTVGAGDRIDLVDESPQAMSVYAVNNLRHFAPSATDARQAVTIEGLAPGWRKAFRKMMDAGDTP
jgi:MOSC domain-containing protein YiiM